MAAGCEGHVWILAVSCRTGPLRMGRSLRELCTRLVTHEVCWSSRW
jgi:hypothetical protein